MAQPVHPSRLSHRKLYWPLLIVQAGFLCALVAPVLAAPPVDLARSYPRGQALAARGKSVHLVAGRLELVLATGSASSIHRELTDLATLGRKGVPVVEIVARGTYGGERGFVMRRYAAGSKDAGGAFWSRVNGQTVKDMGTIARALKRGHVWVDDLQFLISDAGRLVVADPLRVQTGRPGWTQVAEFRAPPGTEDTGGTARISGFTRMLERAARGNRATDKN